jgi:glucosamine kinase
MMPVTLIADGGSTKVEWRLLNNSRKKSYFTQGLSPYFLTTQQIADIVKDELAAKLKNVEIANLFYYGTGCANPQNAKNMKLALRKSFPGAKIEVGTDVLGAARALCGKEKGIASILGTGSSCCFYNGKKITKETPGLGYVLGDEGSGAYLGKKVVQYYLYQTFDEDLRLRFEEEFKVDRMGILDSVYKQPLPNRYLASFALFLAENRGHYMIENILEDGLNDFFFQHLCKYPEVWKHPVHFIGSIAHGFKDIIEQLCQSYEFELGTIMKSPIDGLVKYHRE